MVLFWCGQKKMSVTVAQQFMQGPLEYFSSFKLQSLLSKLLINIDENWFKWALDEDKKP